jgi:8-oxo-dGTP pyrophosphatase MutT (NUDIX family)
VSRADVELPDRTRFTQYVFRMRRCAMIAVLDEPGTSILLLRRHRFIISRQVWEVPGGYVDDGEDGPAGGAPRGRGGNRLAAPVSPARPVLPANDRQRRVQRAGRD